MSLVPNLDTEARAKAQAAFPVGSSVRQKFGGMTSVVLGHTSKGAVVSEPASVHMGTLTTKPEHLELVE